MDDVPDGRDDDVTRTDVPVTRPEPTGPASGQVRIIGAEPAWESTAEIPKVAREEEAPDDHDAGPAEPRVDDLEPVPMTEGAFEQPSVRLTDQPGGAEDAADAVKPVSPGQTAVPGGTPTELPHWTEPPTGQVPAVIARDPGDEGAGTGIAGPTWREEDSDWTAHDELFEPGVLGDEEVPLGSLDETDRSDVDRRPWEFDLDAAGSGPSPRPTGRRAGSEPAEAVDPITEEVDVVAPTGGTEDRHVAEASRAAPGRSSAEPEARSSAGDVDRSPEGPAGAAAAAAAFGATGSGGAGGAHQTSSLFPDDDGAIDEELFAADKPLPTGSARVGRARRSGLLPERLRAKRPEDLDDVNDAPLAAEPPGASVTEVPGAGRKRRGVAGLAAADRTAEREVEADEAVPTGAPGRRQVPAVTAAVAADEVATKPPRRLFRRSSERRAAPPAAAPEPLVPTGGGPPRPDRDGRAKAGAGAKGTRAGTSSVGLRVGTGLAVAVVALLAFKLGTVPSLVLVVIVVTFAAGECFGVLRRAGYHPATLLGLVGTISLMVGAYTKGIAALPLVLVLIVAFTLIWYLFGIERGSPVAGTAATLLTVGWVSLLGSYAGLLLSPSAFPDRHGIAFLLGAIIATVANDVGALVVGGWMGRTPLAPNISPNKTWEGLFGGAVFSILVSTVVVGAIHPWSASSGALLGVVVAVVAPIGDLCESLLKRDLRLKDMGTLLPGHGGVLDRVDALLFVLPATYYLVRALNIA